MPKKCIPKKEIEKWIRSQIRNNIKWAQTALAIAYNNQDPVEKIRKESQYINCRGLTRYDAEHVTNIVRKMLSGKHLLETEEEQVKKSSTKYWKQFIKHFGWNEVKKKFFEDNGQLSLNLK